MEWLSMHHAFVVPEVGERVRITVVPPSSCLTVSPGSVVSGELDGMWLTVPEGRGEIRLRADGVEVYAGNPFDPPAPCICRKRWWSTLLPYQAGYLFENAPVEAVHLEFSPKLYSQTVPVWLATWHVPFFVGLVVTVLALRFRFKIS
jgi:hypothetical protein